MRCDTIWTDARLATMAVERPGAGLGVVEDGIVAALGGRILFAGARSEAPHFEAQLAIDCEGRWITPGLIDCHTHIIHAGSRADEFRRRLEGETYEQIARSGGGILSTVRATRASTFDALVASALLRLDALIAEGVTTIEVKSGYGLDMETELQMLRVARHLAEERPITVSPSFLGAHALPPEYSADADKYVSLICEEMIPLVAAEGLADAVDVYCESIGFTGAQTARIFAAATAHGLPVRVHAEQFSDMGGAALAARHRALSADHLEHLGPDGIAAMAQSGTVATLLPGAFYFTRETQMPPIQALREAGVPIALATDCNPGTSPLTSLLLVLNMGATLFRLTVEECLRGVTINAARALGMAAETGSLEAGKWCDLAVWEVEDLAELVYRIGFNPLHKRVRRGS